MAFIVVQILNITEKENFQFMWFSLFKNILKLQLDLIAILLEYLAVCMQTYTHLPQIL